MRINKTQISMRNLRLSAFVLLTMLILVFAAPSKSEAATVDFAKFMKYHEYNTHGNVLVKINTSGEKIIFNYVLGMWENYDDVIASAEDDVKATCNDLPPPDSMTCGDPKFNYQTYQLEQDCEYRYHYSTGTVMWYTSKQCTRQVTYEY